MKLSQTPQRFPAGGRDARAPRFWDSLISERYDPDARVAGARRRFLDNPGPAVQVSDIFGRATRPTRASDSVFERNGLGRTRKGCGARTRKGGRQDAERVSR
jgi:hypothetical protein